jgi:hypothetical protein
MRAMQWIAVSGVLLASGSTLADTDRPADSYPTVRADDVAKAPPAPIAGATTTDQGPLNPSQDYSKNQPAEVRPEVRPQEKVAPNLNAVTVDPAHPGGDFPWGG